MKNLAVVLIFITFLSCSSDDKEINNTSNDSSSTSDNSSSTSNDSELIDGLTGQLSLFPLAVNPEFTSISEVELADSKLVGIVTFKDSIRVYPYSFVTHNEVVNDEFQGDKYAFSYCPITKSSIAFKRNEIFRASGYLYRDNLAPWDEATETIWSQMLMKGIIGKKTNVLFNTIPVVETTWKTVKDYFPNAKVVTADLFLTRSSSLPPEDDKDNSDSEFSPALNELAYGIIDGSKVYIYKHSDFSESNTIEVIIQAQKYIVYGDAEKQIINALKVSDFESYTTLEGEFPFVLKHSNGTKYDILGRGNDGSTLEKPKYAYIAIWRAWKDFYTNYAFQE